MNFQKIDEPFLGFVVVGGVDLSKGPLEVLGLLMK